MSADDPFRHHPGLRDLITPPEDSFFRDFDPRRLVTELRGKGLEFPLYETDEREAMRRAFLATHDGPLWVFGYGSLMWDPAFDFTDVRRAFAPAHARRFILKDVWGARGTYELPGLMAALDAGEGCHGLAFRIAPDAVEEGTFRIWSRELAGPAYRAEMIDVTLDDSPIRALTFVAEHGTSAIQPDLTREEQVHYLATGTGFLGSSYDYIRNLATHFEEMRIDDPYLTGLLAEVEARMEGRT